MLTRMTLPNLAVYNWFNGYRTVPDSWHLSADDSHTQKGDSQVFGSELSLTAAKSVCLGGHRYLRQAHRGQ